MKVNRLKFNISLSVFGGLVLACVVTGCIKLTIILPNGESTKGLATKGLGTKALAAKGLVDGPSDGPESSGTFTIVQWQSVANDGTATIYCTPTPPSDPRTVSGYVARFMTNQIPTVGQTRFQGYVSNEFSHTLVPNTDYLLQYVVNSYTNGCCTLVGSNEATCTVIPNYKYKFYARFYSSHVPPAGTTFSLYGVFF